MRSAPSRRGGGLTKLLVLVILITGGLLVEGAARHMFFRKEITAALESSKKAPRGVALTGYVKPDIFWSREGFYLVLVNNSEKDLHTGVLEIDGAWRILLKSIDPDREGDLPRGTSVAVSSGYWMSSAELQKEQEKRRLMELPKTLRLYVDEGDYTWTLKK